MPPPLRSTVFRALAVLLILAGLMGIRRGDVTPARLLATAHGRVADCEVGADSREAMLVAAGEEVAVGVSVPPSAVLRFALATADDSPLTWRLSISESTTAEPPLVTATASVLHRWTETSIDLARWAGREVLVRATVTGDPTTPSAAVCWANPRLVRRTNRARLTVVVLLDTVRADHLQLLGYGRPTSRALAALARDGITFEDAASDAPWTRSSVATLFTGRGPLEHQVLTRDSHLDDRWPTLAARLRAAGASTVALSTNPNVLPFWGFARGFDRFVDVDAADWTANSDAARPLALAREAVDMADGDDLLLYVHLNDAHAPYDPPPATAAALLGSYDPAGPGRELAVNSTREEVRGAIDRYDAELAYLDEQLGLFFEYLKTIGRYRDSLIVVVGDHGEEFMDHGGVYHGHTLFREVLHVPLVVKLPGLRGAGTRVPKSVTMRDVMPTVLRVLGIPTKGLPGRVLVDASGRAAAGDSLPRFAIADMDNTTAYAVEDSAFAFIVQTRPAARAWLFDRVADPLEWRDLSAARPLERLRLQRILDDRLLTFRAGWHVRLCGDLTATTVTVQGDATSPIAWLEQVGLEAEDRIVLSPAGTHFRFDAELVPQLRYEENFGRLEGRTRPDVDEIVFATSGSVRIALEPPDAVLRVGGNGDPPPSDGMVGPHDAIAPAAYDPKCGGQAVTFVWRTGRDEAAPPPDRTITERLRALGYVR